MTAGSPAAAPLPALHPDHITALVEGRHPRPHDALGQHPLDPSGGFVVRVIRPLAEAVTIVRADGTRVPLTHVQEGLWQGLLPGPGQTYTVQADYAGAPSWTADDPYRFVPSFGEVDLFLFGQGRHEQLWKVLGAHCRPAHGTIPVACAGVNTARG